jgi:hypothetical protein
MEKISVKNEKVSHGLKEDRNCLLKHVIEEETEKKM